MKIPNPKKMQVMANKNLLYPDFRMEDEDEDKPKEEKKDAQPPLMQKFEETFVEQRKVFFWGVVEEKTCKEVVAKLLYLDAIKPGEEIKLFINSPGGSVNDGMVVYDTIRMISSPVSTICMGMSASMGAILLSAGVKGRRFIYPHGEVMIHQPSLGGVYQGKAIDLEIQAVQIQKAKEMSAKILAENCGQSFERVMKDIDRDYWMDAGEALKYGIVDGIMDKL